MPENVVRYGFVGTGMMGREHMRNVDLVDGSKIAAVFDRDEGSRREASTFAADDSVFFDDLKGLLASNSVDALVIATPNDTHGAVMAEIFESGVELPILLEKPVCTDIEQVRWLSEAARQYRAPIWVGMEYRYMPPVTELIQRVHAGECGDTRMIAMREHRNPFLRKVENWNRYAERTGGTLVEKCCHFFDLMRFIAQDEPVRVFASGDADVNHRDERLENGRRPEIIDNAFVVVDFASGLRASLDLCMFAEGAHWQEEIAVTGTKARLECFVPGHRNHDVDAEIEFSPRATDRPVERHAVEVPPDVLRAGGHHGSTYFEHQKFRKVVLGEGSVEVTLEDGLKAVAIGLAAERSAREKRVVSIDGLDFD
ncbi:Gfo/Idh/MocA family protein [Pararhizobium mangrovi]|uniref:Gfo/Idh/MocA family oxidoreductase n=1 Tax=Pararhizobium mangrovi TaxID=2590452 RepID=A0A506U3F7_9HYPH|nr:Gfo/Idh/MocA family oxidoreductase [Pararhizobium mangrovi]TPW28370.1 Gfo/Idh/MocA family oxidoreductase [Pararhizobium mangrovi]